MRLREWIRLTDGNILTDVALWLILLLPITLYMGIPYPFGLGRLLFFIFWVTLFAAGIMLTRHWQFVYAWWRNPIVWVLLLWVAVATLASATGVQWGRSFWGSINRGEGLLFFIVLFVFFLLLFLCINEKERWLKLLGVMSWIGTLSALFAIMQRLGLTFWIYQLSSDIETRASGLMGNSIILGNFLLLTIFITIYFWIYTEHRFQKIAYLIAIILQLVTLLLTGSRGPLLGLIAGGLLLVVISGDRVYKTLLRWRWKQVLWWIGTPLIALVILGWWERSVWSRLIQFSLQSDTIKSRLLAWATFKDAIVSRPWLGWGLENIQTAFNRFYQPGLAALGGVLETLYDRSHNLLLDYLITTGWIGLLVAVLLFAMICLVVIRATKDAKQQNHHSRVFLFKILLVSGVAYVVALLTSFHVMVTLIYSVVILAAVIGLATPSVKNQIVELKWLVTVPIICFLGLLILDLHSLVPAFRSGHNATIAMSASDVGNYPAAKEYFDRTQAYPNPYLNQILWRFPEFARNYTFELINQKNYPAADKIAAEGLIVLERVLKTNPGNPILAMDGPLINVLLAQFDPTKMETAQEYFNAIIKDNPNREYLYLDWARTLTGVGRFTEAKLMFDKVAQLKPPPREFGFWLAVWGMESKQMSNMEITRNFVDSATKQGIFNNHQKAVLQQAVVYLTQQKSYAAAAYYQKVIEAIDNLGVF